MANSRLQKGFGMVSNEAIRNPDISMKEKGLYAVLASYADKDNNETYISVNRMAAECGVESSTIKRSLTKLVKLGIISRTRRGTNKSWLTKLLK